MIITVTHVHLSTHFYPQYQFSARVHWGNHLAMKANIKDAPQITSTAYKDQWG